MATDMKVYEEIHTSAAQDLYTQRLSWLQIPYINMQSILHLEYRLRLHVQILSHIQLSTNREPEMAPDTFVYLARRFSQPDALQQSRATEQACEWLGENTARAQGARDALLLYLKPAVVHTLCKACRKNASQRVLMMHLLGQSGNVLSRELFRQTQDDMHEPMILAQFLHYAANSSEYDTEVFSQHYLPLLKRASGIVPGQPLLAAIWGGLIRGDYRAKIALHRAIERHADGIMYFEFLRLAALTGDTEYLPLYTGLIESAPQRAFHYLAIYGRPEGVERILLGLEQPRTAHYAETAWWWISGQTLAKKPRMSLVGRQNVSNLLLDNFDYIPEPQAARDWWDRQRQEAGLRYLQGKPLDSGRVLASLKHYTGSSSLEFIDLLSLQYRQPLQLARYGWHEERLRQINSLSLASQIVQHDPMEMRLA